MHIYKITTGKKEYRELLLLADEQESMIERYLDRGDMYALDDHGVRAVCVVTDEGNHILEIKNLAVQPQYQRMGYGRQLLDFLAHRYRKEFRVMQVGTGDSPLTIPFYEACGFRKSHVVKNFFTEHYDHPIFECGRQLVDMVYLRRDL